MFDFLRRLFSHSKEDQEPVPSRHSKEDQEPVPSRHSLSPSEVSALAEKIVIVETMRLGVPVMSNYHVEGDVLYIELHPGGDHEPYTKEVDLMNLD